MKKIDLIRKWNRQAEINRRVKYHLILAQKNLNAAAKAAEELDTDFIKN